jgi:predicted nucleic acid-binding Zn finger protein
MALGYLKGKTPHCYHLVTIKTAAALQLFAAIAIFPFSISL